MEFLKKSWLLGRVGGVEIRLHSSMILIVLVAYYLYRPTTPAGVIEAVFGLVVILLCVFLHEIGHTLVARGLGIPVKSIIMWPLGGVTNLAHPAEKPLHGLLISAAGPLVNVVIALGLWKLLSFNWMLYEFASWLPWQNLDWIDSVYYFVFSMAIMNGVLAAFNLLPIYPLDGGAILHSGLELSFGKANANLVSFIIGIPILLALVALGIYMRDFVLLGFSLLMAVGVASLNQQTSRWLNLTIAYIYRRPVYHYMCEDYDLAIEGFTRAIDRNPKDISLYLSRAGAFLHILERERGKADAQRALALSPEHPMTLLVRGEFYSMDKQYDTALEYIDRALSVKPTWGIPHFDRGSILAEQGNYPAALMEINLAMKYQAPTPLFYFLRSMVYYRLQDCAASQKDAVAALRISQRDALLMQEFNLGVYKGYLDWAMDYYAWALEKLPNSWLVYQGRADAELVNECYEQAIADYTRAIQLAPCELRPYLGRGQAYQKTGQIDCAADDFRRAADLADKSHLRRRAERLLAGLTV
jgi:tetratricopeptide (TPR) repeat protein